jgi:cbb3-type cytochrome oxidase subunit 3
MSNYIESLPDGWTIYLWLVIGAMIILSVVYWIYWGAKNEQFDEDIKYVLFTEDDKDKMDPAEYAKSREVIKAQMESRIRFKAKEEAERQKKEA